MLSASRVRKRKRDFDDSLALPSVKNKIAREVSSRSKCGGKLQRIRARTRVLLLLLQSTSMTTTTTTTTKRKQKVRPAFVLRPVDSVPRCIHRGYLGHSNGLTLNWPISFILRNALALCLHIYELPLFNPWSLAYIEPSLISTPKRNDPFILEHHRGTLLTPLKETLKRSSGRRLVILWQIGFCSPASSSSRQRRYRQGKIIVNPGH